MTRANWWATECRIRRDAVALVATGIAFALAGEAAVPCRASAQGDIERFEVAPAVYLLRTPFDAFGQGRGNSTVIVNDSDVIVFDSGMLPSTARGVIREIRKLTDKPVGLVINSHWHQDHWSGNRVFADTFPGVEIIATARTREIMVRVAPMFGRGFTANLERAATALESVTRAGNSSLDERRALEAQIARQRSVASETAFKRLLPTMVFDDTLTFWRNGREFRLIGSVGDATGSAVLYLPRERVLIVGDLLTHPTLRGATRIPIVAWLESLRALERLEASAVIPGHGPAFHDTEYLSLAVELLDRVVRDVNAALERGAVTLAEVSAVVHLDDLESRFARLGARYPRESLIEAAFRQARDGMEEGR